MFNDPKDDFLNKFNKYKYETRNNAINQPLPAWESLLGSNIIPKQGLPQREEQLEELSMLDMVIKNNPRFMILIFLPERFTDEDILKIKTEIEEKTGQSYTAKKIRGLLVELKKMFLRE